MKEETLMNKLLDGHIKTTETLGEIGAILKRHDEVTFPEIKNELKEQSKKIDEVHEKTFNIDSWKNGIIRHVTDEKEKLRADMMLEINPLKKDLEERSKLVSAVKKKGWDIFWDWIKIVLTFLAGYLLTLISKQ